MASNLPSVHRLLVQREVCPLNLSDRWHILPFLHSMKTSLFPHSALQIGHQELPFLTQLLFSFCFPPFSTLNPGIQSKNAILVAFFSIASINASLSPRK